MNANYNNKPEQQQAIDTEYCEVPTAENATATETTNNKEETVMNTNNNLTNDSIKLTREEKETLINAFADGIAKGEFDRDDVYEVGRRADYLIKADKRAKREMEKAEAKAKREAERNKTGKTLTVGQKVWIGIGIAATVVVIGGIVYWIIQKKRNTTESACDSADAACKLSAKFDRLVTV